jgi:hypothetical protein
VARHVIARERDCGGRVFFRDRIVFVSAHRTSLLVGCDDFKSFFLSIFRGVVVARCVYGLVAGK